MERVNPVLRHVRKLQLPAYGDDEVEFVASIMDRFRPTHVFEWGTNVGASARLFYEAAQVLSFPCEVHTVELPLILAYLDPDHPGRRYGKWIKGLPISTHRGDGLTESLIAHAMRKPKRALFFIDGYHEHESVLRELKGIATADPKAVILCHDTLGLTGPFTAIAAFLDQHEYVREDCLSDSGMTALWPRLA